MKNLLLLALISFTLVVEQKTQAYDSSSFSYPLPNGKGEEVVANNGSRVGIWVTISERGLSYVKDVLTTEILGSVTPLALPDIRKKVKVPGVGDVKAALTQISLLKVVVPKSAISLNNSGITMAGAGVHTNLTLHWDYKYQPVWVPTVISDGGTADVKVAQLQTGVMVNLEEQDGGLGLVLLECGVHIKELNIDLHGGTSWIYQWIVDAFEDRVRMTVENQLSGEIRKGVEKLNSLLSDLPRNATVDELSIIDFTVVEDPIISPTTISIGLKGDFISMNELPSFPHHGRHHLWIDRQPGLQCSNNLKMVTIALSESLLNSAAAIYYTDDFLNQMVEKLPDQAYLNTAKWKYLIPQLYKQYPNKEMKFEFEVLSPPAITVSPDGVQGLASANMILEVLDNNETVSVASISIELSVHGTADISKNNIIGQLAMTDINLALVWSHVGNFHIKLVEAIVSSLVKDAVLPILNLNLRKGFPLPIVSSIKLQQSDVEYENGYILVCTDIKYVGSVNTSTSLSS